jgi:hypothetical protein
MKKKGIVLWTRDSPSTLNSSNFTIPIHIIVVMNIFMIHIIKEMIIFMFCYKFWMK